MMTRTPTTRTPMRTRRERVRVEDVALVLIAIVSGLDNVGGPVSTVAATIINVAWIAGFLAGAGWIAAREGERVARSLRLAARLYGVFLAFTVIQAHPGGLTALRDVFLVGGSVAMIKAVIGAGVWAHTSNWAAPVVDAGDPD